MVKTMHATAMTIKPDIGLTDESRIGVTGVLKTVLADEFVFYTKLRNYHWNVTGPEFRSLHKMFEEQYTQLATVVDETAERIRSYGEFAPGTLAEFGQFTRLNENPGEYPTAREMVIALLSDHETMIRYLRNDIKMVGSNFNDVGAEDYLTGLLQAHQEMAWMLRTFIEGEPIGP
jgi:starvation-inducible DNA-binding protein